MTNGPDSRIEQTPATRRRGRPRKHDTDALTDAVMRAYWLAGPDALSVNDLARTLGVSKPALYRTFGDEDGVLEAALGRYRTLKQLPLLERLREPTPLAVSLARLASWLAADRSPIPGCLLAKSRNASRDFGPATRRRIETMRDELRGAFEDWAARAAERGELRADLDPTFVGGYVDAQLTQFLMDKARGLEPTVIEARARLAFGALLPLGESMPSAGEAMPPQGRTREQGSEA